MSFEKEIDEQINKHTDHILEVIRSKNLSYYSNFKKAMSLIDEKGIVPSNKAKRRLYNKLLIGSDKDSFNVNKYLQGVSEVLFWIYAAKNGLNLETDYRLNPDNGNDVDIRIKAENHFFNIEIKCPDQVISSDKHLSLSYAYRVQAVSKAEVDNVLSEIESMIQPGIDAHPEMGIVGSERKKTNDNKIITYMDSAQEKFTYSDSDINILVISVPSSEMQHYYSYLCNPDSGILAGGLDSFKRMPKEFDKIDIVMLTNIVSGHDKVVDIDSWDLSNYCTIGFINPYSDGIMKKTKPLSKMLRVLPDEAVKFQNERIKILARDIPCGLPADQMLMFEYLATHCPNLYKPDEKRTMWFKNGKINPEFINE